MTTTIDKIINNYTQAFQNLTARTYTTPMYTPIYTNTMQSSFLTAPMSILTQRNLQGFHSSECEKRPTLTPKIDYRNSAKNGDANSAPPLLIRNSTIVFILCTYIMISHAAGLMYYDIFLVDNQPPHVIVHSRDYRNSEDTKTCKT